MYIQPTTNYNIASKGSFPNNGKGNSLLHKIKQKIVDIMPKGTFGTKDFKQEHWNKIDEYISRPAQNRMIVGATAMVSQPALDYYNHKVDKETRTVSRNRTIAKIIAGVAVGVLVRGSVYKFIKGRTDIKGLGKNSKKLIPKMFMDDFMKNDKHLKNYRNALSTLAALLVMSITNFTLDAPLTIFLTNYLNKNTKSLDHQGKAKNNDTAKLKEGVYA